MHRVISNVVIMDYEGISGNFTDFHTGDFVITNLLFAKDDPSLIYQAFKQLMNIGISAIAIKDIFFTEIPDEVIELADISRVPVFFFNSIYIEDVLLNITDHIRSENNFNYGEELINQFYARPSNEENIYNLLNYMQTIHYTHVSTMYISYRNPIDDFTLQRHINKIRMKKNQIPQYDRVSFIKYHKGILFFYFYADNEDSNLLKNWQQLIYDLDIELSLFRIGVNDSLLPVLKTDIAILRALYSNRICNRTEVEQKIYSTLTLDNFALALSTSAYTKEYLMDLYGKLSTLDPNKSSQLIETLTAYAKCRFQIEKTGEMLFQHPNTVRYRISKMKSLFGVEDDFSFQIIAMLMTELILYSEH